MVADQYSRVCTRARVLLCACRRLDPAQRQAFKEALTTWREARAEEFEIRYFYILPEPEVSHEFPPVLPHISTRPAHGSADAGPLS